MSGVARRKAASPSVSAVGRLVPQPPSQEAAARPGPGSAPQAGRTGGQAHLTRGRRVGSHHGIRPKAVTTDQDLINAPPVRGLVIHWYSDLENNLRANYSKYLRRSREGRAAVTAWWWWCAEGALRHWYLDIINWHVQYISWQIFRLR